MKKHIISLIVIYLSIINYSSCYLLMNPMAYLLTKNKVGSSKIEEKLSVDAEFNNNPTFVKSKTSSENIKIENEKCESINFFSPKDIGFYDEFKNKMYRKFFDNINWNETGAVIAADDPDTPGGDYRYNWMRDAGLTMHTFMDLNHDDYHKVKDKLRAYVEWVVKAQHTEDVNNVDVRIEPKFYLQEVLPFAGRWCRPQNDGPAIRANALRHWTEILKRENMIDEVKNKVWPLIKYDLEWIVNNWNSDGCDLWEEIRSNDFYFVKMAYIHTQNTVKPLATEMEDIIFANAQGEVAKKIQVSQESHWNGKYLLQTANREIDGAVMQSIATFNGEWQTVSDNKVAKTIQVYNKAFCNEYQINQDDIDEGLPAVLYGRYPGDIYGGGNPWQLLSAALAEVFYKASKEVIKSVENSEGKINYLSKISDNYKSWQELFGIDGDKSYLGLAELMRDAGDGVMSRVWKYVKNDNGRIDEQIDKFKGNQYSARGLTWSYANVLHALHVRNEVNSALFKLKNDVKDKRLLNLYG